MSIPSRLGIAGVAVVGLLAGCTTSGYPSATFTGSTVTSPPASSAVPSSPTPTGAEAAVTKSVVDYYAWANRVLIDPSVPVNEAAKYLVDVAPDNVLTAVEQRIVQFRNDGYRQTGSSVTSVVSVTAADSTYQARTCSDSSAVTVTDSKGAEVDPGATRAAALYTLVKGVDGVWRISKIQGTGTC